MAIYNQFEVVVVPLISDRYKFSVDKSILTMITTKEHHPRTLDLEIKDLNAAGLKAPSIVRFKSFTLEGSLIVRKIGSLSRSDITIVRAQIKKVFNLSS